MQKKKKKKRKKKEKKSYFAEVSRLSCLSSGDFVLAILAKEHSSASNALYPASFLTVDPLRCPIAPQTLVCHGTQHVVIVCVVLILIPQSLAHFLQMVRF